MGDDQGEMQELPVLPLKQGALFPSRGIPVTVGRTPSLQAVEAALASPGKDLVVLMQKDAGAEEPDFDGLHRIGTRAVIQEASRPDPGVMEVILMGQERVELAEPRQSQPYKRAAFRALPLPAEQTPEVEARRRELIEMALQVVSFSEPMAAGEIAQYIGETKDPVAVLYLLAAIAHPEPAKAQEILQAPTLIEAMRLLQDHLAREIQVLEVRRDIARQTQSEINKEQREYLLRQNLRAIREELGEKNPEEAEVNLLRQRFQKAELPQEVRAEAERELDRLAQLPAISPEFMVLRTYLDFVLELPWTRLTEESLDLGRARQILDADHYGLKEVKERILEHLGVMKLNPQAKSPILCFVGAPGVGKTSVGQSIARAIGRKFERMSLGGLHDEAELRGHRRTYVGALPGRIIQALRRAGTRNPLLMLDEIDKLGRDFRGDPAAALLEILDPDQNATFRDNYLDLPFDLSKVFFITTANTLDTIPPPLLDRMEILRFAGYSNQEKERIAEEYLIPRELKETGLPVERCGIQAPALRELITRYTREAGVRQLERAIGSVFRKLALQFAEDPGHPSVQVQAGDLAGFLGPAPFFEETARQELSPGVAVGMAWTETGGTVIYIECALLPGTRGLTLTGQLGPVMQESARAAQTYVAAHAAALGIDPSVFKRGVHLHVPAGAVPKDGPSAGVTMAAALASLYSGLAARGDTAATGEITLSGLVLPVGGIKEKVLAAHRSGMKRIVLPRENEKDLSELPDHVRQALEFVLAEKIEDVLHAVIPGLAPPTLRQAA